MRNVDDSESGLGMVEVIVGMVLLAIIAVTILPALWQGLRYSTEQSAVATATRRLNSMVEQVRDDPTCSRIIAAAATQTFPDGGGRTLTSKGTFTQCPPSSTSKIVTLTLNATDASNQGLATVTAIVYVP